MLKSGNGRRSQHRWGPNIESQVSPWILSRVGVCSVFPYLPPDQHLHGSMAILRVTNNVTNNQKIRPHFPAKALPADGISDQKGWLCMKDFLHVENVESCSLQPRLLAKMRRALVLTETATPHAARYLGASISRLSLEHKGGHVTPAKCTVSPFAHRRRMRKCHIQPM